jgi:cytochrome c
MNLFRRATILTTFALLLQPGPSSAQEAGTAAEAKAMVLVAVEHAKKVGPEQAFKDFSDVSNKTFHNKDLYVFAFNNEGVQVAHGVNEKLIGKNMNDVKDPSGTFFVRAMRERANSGGGWVEFEWPHPQTKKVMNKSAFVQKFANYDGFVGVGVYK